MEKLKFEDLQINKSLKKAVEAVGYVDMTPIQEQAIPVVLSGKDIIAQAPTGTGKTCSFALPALNNVDPDDKNVQVLVLCPTRELAVQVANEFKKLSKFTEQLRTTTIYGGQDINVQIRSLKKFPQVIVGTPGRVIDHLKRKTLKIEKLKTLVLDEADEMLNMGFREDLDEILENTKNDDRQTLLFSATMPEGIKRITKLYQKIDTVSIKTTYNENALPNISQYYVELNEKNKIDCLSRMIDAYNFKQALVFCRTKKKVDDLSVALTSRGFKVECIHGDMKQAGREKVMDMFRNGIVRVLIATDVAARGIDIDGIDAVFNYDIPDDVEYYVHRIGRTARAGREGSSYTFVVRSEKRRIQEFEKTLKTVISKIDPPSFEMAESNKINNMMKDVIKKNGSKDLTKYIEKMYAFLASMEEPIEIDILAACLLRDEIEANSKYRDAGLDLTEKTSKKQSSTKKDYVRIFINLGRKDELNKAVLCDLIRTKRHVESSMIEGIDILNTYSFFEIPSKKVDVLLNEINGISFNGRTVDAEVCKNEKSSGSSSRSRSRTSESRGSDDRRSRSRSGESRGSDDRRSRSRSGESRGSDDRRSRSRSGESRGSDDRRSRSRSSESRGSDDRRSRSRSSESRSTAAKATNKRANISWQ